VQKPKKIAGIMTIGIMLTVLCVFGVYQLSQSNEWLRSLRGRSVITEQTPLERSSRESQIPQPQPNERVNQKPPRETDTGQEPQEIPEEMPGNQDLDDYGKWLPRYEQPEREPAPVYRNETILIPIE